jgi:hypothetical protein
VDLAGFDDASQGHDLLSGGPPWTKTALQAQEAGIEGRENAVSDDGIQKFGQRALEGDSPLVIKGGRGAFLGIETILEILQVSGAFAAVSPPMHE